VEKLNFSTIARILELMASIGEDRIHFLNIIARIVVERLSAYEGYLEFLSSNKLNELRKMARLEGIVAEIPSEKVLILEGNQEQIELLKHLQMFDKLKGMPIGSLGYQIFNKDYWDQVKAEDEY